MGATEGRIDELRERLRQLDAARGVMEDTTLDAIRAEAEAELEKLLGGGDETAGDARRLAASGRSVVIGRDADQVIIVTGDGNRVLASDADPELLFEAYLASLEGDCGRLPLGVIDAQFVRAGARHGRGEQVVKLPDVYVGLEVTAPERPEAEEGERAWAWRLVRGEAPGRVSLLEALAEGSARRHVLLGDPGSGKTTFAHYLCHLLASEDAAPAAPLEGLVPLRFVLREVAAQVLATAGKGTAEMLWSALEQNLVEILGADGARHLLPEIQRRVLERGAFVVLDGLDEVPEAGRRRQVLLQAVTAFAAALRRSPSRFLVTARPYAYADTKWHLEGFEMLALAPFSQEQVERFIDLWYLAAARRAFGWSEATAAAKARYLRTALEARPYLGDLASRPLLLTLMATLHSSWGQLPEDRADLYEETVKLLLGRWQRFREVTAADGESVTEASISRVLAVAESRLREALERLAYAVHERQGAGGARRAPDQPARGRLGVPAPFVPGVSGGLPPRQPGGAQRGDSPPRLCRPRLVARSGALGRQPHPPRRPRQCGRRCRGAAAGRPA